MGALSIWLIVGGLAQAADWRADLDARVSAAWREHPVEATAATRAEPIHTRTGQPRFVGEEVWNPAATPILLERLIEGQEEPAVRIALVEAVVRSGGDWSESVVGLLQVEPDAAVRRMLAEVLREAEAGPAAEGLGRAFRDPESAVREAAMRAIAGRADGARFEALVQAGLFDRDAGVRQHAARAAGWLHLGQSWGAIEALLSDESAEVRLSALRALERLDAPRLGALPVLQTLRRDRDPRVARAASAVGR